MRLHALTLLFVLSASVGCQKSKVDGPTTLCETPYADARRSDESVSRISATILAVGNQGEVYQILPDGLNSVPWGPCNLPQPFRKDSLNVLVSGYFLTSPFLKVANVSPLPFEITAIEPR